jgi:hypothetical protein
VAPSCWVQRQVIKEIAGGNDGGASLNNGCKMPLITLRPAASAIEKESWVGTTMNDIYEGTADVVRWTSGLRTAILRGPVFSSRFMMRF